MMNPIPPAIGQIASDGQLAPRQKRRLLLKLALQRVRPGTGSSHEFMLRRTAMNPWPDLRHVLKGVDWVIADISRMPGWADEATLDRVRQIVAHYSPEDMDDLESLIFWASRSVFFPQIE